MSSQQHWPVVAVLIPAFNRGKLLNHNLQLLGQHLRYEGAVKVLVSDDSDNDDLAFIPEPETVERTFPIQYRRNPQRLGLGANLNQLLQMAGPECEYAIAMDDDHVLVKPLDITPYMLKLMTDRTAGWIRLMGSGGHKFTATLEESFWRVSWHSSELYLASFRAHLFKLQQWHAMYGPYPVTQFIGQSEEQFNHICIDIARQRIAEWRPTLDVLVPLSAPEDAWSESGHSWQLQGY
jgi:glycosyltransferase involved in cell wall biosynthesis